MKKILILLVLSLFLSTSILSAGTAATVNGMKITVNDANKALKVLTKGKMTWAKLPRDGKQQLIQMLAPAKLVAVAAKKQLTKKEKEAALTGFWMQKKMSKIKVSDKEAKSVYNKMKKASKASKSKKKLPAYKQAKNSIKMQIAQEKVVSRLMKKAKIKIK